MTQSSRVYITGISTLTACGATADETWTALIEGKSGIAELKQADVSSWTHRLGGEIKDYQPLQMLPDRKLLKVISRQDVLGINAAMQAVEHSRLIDYRATLASPEKFNDETAIYVGSPGNKYYQQYDFLPLVAKTDGDMQEFAKQLFSEVHPMWLLRILPNNVLAYTGITYGFTGINQNVTNHAVSGTQAIIEAFHAIKNGQAKRAVIVAYDVACEAQGLYYYEKLGVISERHLKPFDHEHDGTLLAEGAAALVLESEESVKERGAKCYGEIVGGLSASEAAGLFSIEAEGDHLVSLMTQTLQQYQVHTNDVGFLVAHGNGNKKSDISEAHAICQVFGENEIPVTAFKWAMGHTVCASGVLDAALATLVFQHKLLPGIANLEQLATDCRGINAVRDHRAYSSKRPYAMVVNRGYASMNACLLLKACD